MNSECQREGMIGDAALRTAFANGAAAETYVDYVQRRVFDNYTEYLALYGEERTIREMPLPRISTARLVPAELRARLDGQTAA